MVERNESDWSNFFVGSPGKLDNVLLICPVLLPITWICRIFTYSTFAWRRLLPGPVSYQVLINRERSLQQVIKHSHGTI